MMENNLIMEEINNYIENIYNINTSILILNAINLNNKIEIKCIYGIKIPFLQKIINGNIFNFIKLKISKEYIKVEGMINEILQLNNILKNEIYNFNFLINIFLKRSNKFNNNYNILIEILDIMIQLRLKTRLNNGLNTDFYSEGKEIKLEKSFLDSYIKNNNINNININEINLNDDNNRI